MDTITTIVNKVTGAIRMVVSDSNGVRITERQENVTRLDLFYAVTDLVGLMVYDDEYVRVYIVSRELVEFSINSIEGM